MENLPTCLLYEIARYKVECLFVFEPLCKAIQQKVTKKEYA